MARRARTDHHRERSTGAAEWRPQHLGSGDRDFRPVFGISNQVSSMLGLITTRSTTNAQVLWAAAGVGLDLVEESTPSTSR